MAKGHKKATTGWPWLYIFLTLQKRTINKKVDKAQKMENQDSDIFIRYSKYPDAKNIFNRSVPDIESIKDNCLFILDTNVLLKPYEARTEDLAAIKKLYKKLISQNRLFIPGQVAREFIDNRPLKIKVIDQNLTKHQEKISEAHKNKFLQFNYDKYPLLSDMPEYKELTNIEVKLDEKAVFIQKKIKTEMEEYNNMLSEYKARFSDFKKKVDGWNWRDPVSLMYSELFTEEIIVEYDFNDKSKEQIKIELDNRFKHKIPPGYKDSGKPDDGIGDLIIWYTILQIAKDKKKDIVFVSGDEKNDWFIRSEKKALYPRFELINEFKNNVPENEFTILKFSDFLETLKAPKDTVKRVQQIPDYTNHDIFSKAEEAVIKWYRSFIKYDLFEFYRRSFPDIIFTSRNLKKVGVEIKVASQYKKHLYSSLEYTFLKAKLELSKNNFDMFTLVVVIPHYIEIELSPFMENVIAIIEKTDISSDLYSIVVGRLTDVNEFSLISTLNDNYH